MSAGSPFFLSLQRTKNERLSRVRRQIRERRLMEIEIAFFISSHSSSSSSQKIGEKNVILLARFNVFKRSISSNAARSRDNNNKSSHSDRPAAGEHGIDSLLCSLWAPCPLAYASQLASSLHNTHTKRPKTWNCHFGAHFYGLWNLIVFSVSTVELPT